MFGGDGGGFGDDIPPGDFLGVCNGTPTRAATTPTAAPPARSGGTSGVAAEGSLLPPARGAPARRGHVRRLSRYIEARKPPRKGRPPLEAASPASPTPTKACSPSSKAGAASPPPVSAGPSTPPGVSPANRCASTSMSA